MAKHYDVRGQEEQTEHQDHLGYKRMIAVTDETSSHLRSYVGAKSGYSESLAVDCSLRSMTSVARWEAISRQQPTFMAARHGCIDWVER